MTITTIVSGAPPTPNGGLHLGHLSGPYSGADIYVRAQRLHGNDALYIVGSDIHQSYVPVKARQLAADVQALAKGFDDEISHLFHAMQFATAGYVRPQESQLHTRMVSEFIETLHRNGKLVAREEDCLYCPRCERYLFEAHVTGACPHCGDDDCDGNLCEVCAWPNVCTDLSDPHCNQCGTPASLRSFTRLTFPLSQYADQLRAYHRSVVMSPQLEALTTDLLDHGLPDVAVTHPTDWGLTVPVDGFEDQRIYVWAEMVPGYWAEVAEALQDRGLEAAGWRATWDGAQTVQFFGWDNGYFHTLLFPALMMAYDPAIRLPAAFCTNEFYLLDDAKFSTSRRHAIWGGALLAEVPANVVRFALAYDRPQFARTSFTFARFHDLVDGELVARWQAWLTDLLTAIDTLSGGRIPDAEAATPSQRLFITGLTTLAHDCLAAYAVEQFSPRRAARMLCELVSRARDFADGQRRLYGSQPVSAQALAGIGAAAQAAKLLAQLAAPIMPGFAQDLWTALGCAGPPVWDDCTSLPAGQSTGAGRLFFRSLPADLPDRVVRP